MAGPAWWLGDGEARHAEAPRSFFIPPLIERAALAPGATVKLLFEFDPRTIDGETWDGERMWVEVTERSETGVYSGRLDNRPKALTELSLGDVVSFEPRHVIAIEYSTEQLGYDPGEWAHGDARIIEEDRPPGALMSATPPGSDHAMWFVSVDWDAPERRMDFTLGALTDRWPELAQVFASSGGRWERDSDGYRRVPSP